MEGRILVTILGLLLAQVVGAVVVGATGASFIIEAVIALIFLIAAASFLSRAAARKPGATAPAVFAFILGFLNIIYLTYTALTLWVVLLLCLDAAGFILALDQLQGRRRPLPKARKPRLEVYHHGDHAMRSKATKRKATSKTTRRKKATSTKGSKQSTRKTGKKPGRPKKTTRKTPEQRKTAKKTSSTKGSKRSSTTANKPSKKRPGRPRKNTTKTS